MGSPLAASSNRIKGALLLALLAVLVAGPMVERYGAQQAARYTLTAAIWDHQTVQLDLYAETTPPVLGRDRAIRDGRTFSDKAPLQPMLAIPVYAAYRAVGGEPATVQRIEGNLGVWSSKFWTSAIPGGALLVLMWFAARRMNTSKATASAAAVFFGTVLFPLSSVLFGHVLSAALLFGAFVLVLDTNKRGLALAGALASLAVLAEYTTALGVLVIGGYVVWRWRLKALYFVAGGLPGLAALMIYNTIAFGGPTTLSYQWSAHDGILDAANEVAGIFTVADFTWAKLGTLLFAGRGLAVATPIVLVALGGLIVLAIRGGKHERAVAVASLAAFFAFAAMSANWGNQWGGASPGPRYLTPGLPFLVFGLPVVWKHMKVLTTTAAAVSIATMTLATITAPLMAVDSPAGLGGWIKLAFDGQLSPSIFTLALGSTFGWVVHLALIAALVAWIFLDWRRGRVTPQSSSELPKPVPT